MKIFTPKQILSTLFLLIFSSSIAQTSVFDTIISFQTELDPVTITSQHGNQRLLDIPASITAINARTLENANIVTMEQLAGFVPGLNVLMQTPGRPNLVIRGLTSDEVSPTAQPRVSVYFNHAPISRATMAVTELYDMERIEVLKGPQGTLFGRGAQAGAISFITRKPTDYFGGYVTTGFGNFGMAHVEGALNLPVIEHVLSTRIAGIYSYHDGYVKNTSGGKLNGKNTAGGRFTTSFTPKNSQFRADLTVNYQRDDEPGTAFMSRTLPNDEVDIFKYEATLDENGDFYNKREVFGTILNTRYHTNEKNYFSSITSFFNNKADSRFDGDGSAAPAIDMEERGRAKQFMQELRYNFSHGSRFTGIAGASFWRENVNHLYTFRPGEQYLAALMMQYFMPELIPPGYQLFVDGKPNPLTALVVPGWLLGLPLDLELPLAEYHVEDNYTEAVNSSYDLFFDASYEIFPKLTFTAGVHGTFETFTITNRSRFVDGERSALGMMSGRFPNFFFKPVDNPKRSESFFGLTWRAALKYDLDNRSNIYAGYSKGRRPNVLQYDSEGKYEVIDAEKLHSFDVGYRIFDWRFMFDISLYYQLYRDFQSWKWEGMDYLQEGIDKATSYGTEISARYWLNKYLTIFGNYAYIHATFDDKDNNGKPQLNAGNSFRLTPRNSFLLGFTAGFDVANNIRITLTPTYSWKSQFFFEDSNDKGIEQDAYGLLNANFAVHFKKQGLTASLFGSNLTNEKYLIGAGNMGAMFGIPTFVPGAPKMIGARLTWKFNS
ncbi:MAG: TonB-dependent receptor [Bacteroidales bacterium]|jgi:outer membrane receptor protein involved in Fe transport|nr:TonB-dependent receptor [Bacteroidales bacterium]